MKDESGKIKEGAVYKAKYAGSEILVSIHPDTKRLHQVIFGDSGATFYGLIDADLLTDVAEFTGDGQ